MSDEVSTGELSRAIAELKGIMQGLLSLREHEEFRRHVEHRLDEHDRDIEAERHARDAAIKELRAEQAGKSSGNRTAFLGFVGAVAAAIIFAAIQGWIAGKGGR